jgi:hypothetical protein
LADFHRLPVKKSVGFPAGVVKIEGRNPEQTDDEVL